MSPADDGAGAWIPYLALLLRLTRMSEARPPLPQPRSEDTPAVRPSWYTDRDQQRRATEEWLQKVLSSLRRRPTVLLAHAQNARSRWTWLQDGRIEMDRMKDGHAMPRRLDPDLRLVQVRTALGRETPHWWGLNPKLEPNGVPANLWSIGSPEMGRVFYSTTPKPVQFSASGVEADKLAPRPLRKGPRAGELTIDTGKPGWTPGLVEITVAGCHPQDGDSPEALSLPLPLHLAGLGQEYVLPMLAADDETPSPADAGPDLLDDDEVDSLADLDPAQAEAAGLADEPAEELIENVEA